MSNEVTIGKERIGTDLQYAVTLREPTTGLLADFSQMDEVFAVLYSDDQRRIAGRFQATIDEEDTHILRVFYDSDQPEFLGLNRIVLRCTTQGHSASYDAPCVEFVPLTEQVGTTAVEEDVVIELSAISQDYFDQILAACIDATERAEQAAEQAEADHTIAVEDHTTAAADHTQASADHTQATADHTAAAADHTQAASDHTKAASDHTKAAADHEQAAADHTTAAADHTQAAADHTAAVEDHEQAAADHDTAAADHQAAETDHSNAQEDHALAASDHAVAAADHTRAVEDHTTAAADHTQAAADHQTAGNDHTQAAADHSTAATDHTQAAADHTQAASDHSTAAADHTQAASDHTRAEADHTAAAADHTQAAADHTRAVEDHTKAEEATAAAIVAAEAADEAREGIQENLARKANIDGYYKQLVAGLAENLVDTKGTGSEQVFTDRTSCGDESIADDGTGVIKELRGNSLAWNQILAASDFNDTTSSWGVTMTANSDGSVSFSGTIGDGTVNIVPIKSTCTKAMISGHKYFLRGQGNLLNFRISSNEGNVIFTAPSSALLYSEMRVRTAAQTGTVINETIRPDLIDLTLMFGAGKEPSTVAEFEAMYHELYYPHNNGAIINNAADMLVTVGFNQCVEPPINLKAGELFPAFDKTKYTFVFGGKRYHIHHKSLGVTNWRHSYKAFDIDGNPITANLFSTLPSMGPSYRTAGYWLDGSDNNGTEQTAVFARDCYVYFGYGSGAVTASTPIEDFNVNLSWSGYRDGEYEPYWKRETGVDMRKIYGKLNGEGEMVQVFPAGGRSAVNPFDLADLVRKEAYVRVGSVDLGNLAWSRRYDNEDFIADLPLVSNNNNTICSKYSISSATVASSQEDKSIRTTKDNTKKVIAKDSSYTDAATFKSAMSGVELNYELATPLHYTDLMYSEDGGETFVDIPTVYKVADFGTERIRPLVDAQGNPTTAPFRAVIQYNDDFTREIVNLPKNYDTTDSLDDAIAAMSSAIGAALNGALTVTRGAYNPATKKYAWSADFIPNSE